jgi:CheY-like chemotaxis protein
MDLRELFIVDDNADHRYLLEQIFNKYLPDYPARFFEGGEQLYRYLSDQDAGGGDLPAAIVLDLYMPYLTGIQVLKSLKSEGSFSRCKRIPVIIMTSTATEQQISECYEAGANAFVRKPSEFSELKNLLMSVCAFWIGANRLPN